MFLASLKKELKLFFRNKGNLAFMFVFPIVLIAIMSYALQSMIGAEVDVSDESGKVLYIMETDGENSRKFEVLKNALSANGSISFEEISSAEKESGQEQVVKQEAYGLITVTDDAFEYYRSPYNEPYASRMIRTYFKQVACLNTVEINSAQTVEKEVLSIKRIDSKTYYTLVELSFMMMYIAMIIAKSVFEEKELKTASRIKLSGASIRSIIFSKISVGLVIGIIQILIVYFFSLIVFGIRWGKYTLLMMLMFLILALATSSIGAAIGAVMKNKNSMNTAVMMLALICGLLGGMFTPTSYLDSTKVLAVLMRCTPLYWINKSLISLQQGSMTSMVIWAIVCCGVISILMTALAASAFRKNASNDTEG